MHGSDRSIGSGFHHGWAMRIRAAHNYLTDDASIDWLQWHSLHD
jgi:hypothetical protein